MDPFDLSWMIGRSVQVELVAPAQWVFKLGDNFKLNVECPWRLLRDGKVAVSSEDHQQKYGLPKPVDSAAEAMALLSGVAITRAEALHGTRDLIINFGSDLRLEVIPFSIGYESWHLFGPKRTITVRGRGEISAW